MILDKTVYKNETPFISWKDLEDKQWVIKWLILFFLRGLKNPDLNGRGFMCQQALSWTTAAFVALFPSIV